MSQTVMILLVTAVVTIITTVITVRYTMLGRVLSPSASDKLKERTAKYGVYIWIAIWWPVTTVVLVREVLDSEPLTRGAVLRIAIYTSAEFFWAALLATMVIFDRIQRLER